MGMPSDLSTRKAFAAWMERNKAAAITAIEARVRAEVISEVLALPKRFERLGGQTYAYIKAEEIDALHTAKSRAIAEADEL